MITLHRSTMASLPSYFMSLLPIPRMVRLRIEQIQINFLWGGGAIEWQPHLVSDVDDGLLRQEERGFGD